VYSVEGSRPSYLKLPYPESALALIQHTIREAVSNRPAKRLITSDNYRQLKAAVIRILALNKEATLLP
jgi:hypothetical protein